MKIAVITANMGQFDKEIEPVKQSIDFDFYKFTNKNFPARHCSMTARLQARIPKTFSWQMIPDYDIYVWVDSSCALLHTDSVKWFIENLGDNDIAVFKHPNRHTIQEEANYLKERFIKKCKYITPRYENELIDEQLEEIFVDKNYIDKNLYASTAFVYRNNDKMQKALKEWWYHISRFHSIDQLSLPYILWQFNCNVGILPGKYMHIPYLTYVRNKKI